MLTYKVDVEGEWNGFNVYWCVYVGGEDLVDVIDKVRKIKFVVRSINIPVDIVSIVWTEESPQYVGDPIQAKSLSQINVLGNRV